MLLCAALPLAAEEPSSQQLYAKAVLAKLRQEKTAYPTLMEQARSKDPDAFPLMKECARLKQGEGDITAASTLYREFAKKHPDRLEGQLIYADFLRQTSPDDSLARKLTIETLERADQNFPNSPDVLERLFRISEVDGMRERSVAILERIGKAEPLTPALAVLGATIARTVYDADDPKGTAFVDALYQRALATSPKYPVLARTVSDYFRESGRMKEAIEALELHTKAAPASIDLRIRLSLLYLSANRDTEALKELNEILTIDPHHVLAHKTLAKWYRKQGKDEQARAHAAAVLRDGGGPPEEWLALADEWLNANDPRQARILLEKAVFKHTKDANLAAKLAIATRRDPETRSHASRLFRQAEAMAGPDTLSKDPVFLSEFAGALIDENTLDLAADRLRAAIRLFPPDAPKPTAAALRQLADLWDRQQKNAEAAAALRERAQKLDPK